MSTKKAYLVSGGAFGDEGKGTLVDYLCKVNECDLVVRVGGPQAGHNVILPDGTHFTFAQFGSGTLHGIPTHLAAGMVVAPGALLREANELMQLRKKQGMHSHPLNLVTMDPLCVLITPWHKGACRDKENSRKENKHGSVGMGVWEAVSHQPTLRLIDVMDGGAKTKLRKICEGYSLKWGDMDEYWAGCFLDDCKAMLDFVRPVPDQQMRFDRCVIENSQGMLLHPYKGEVPYVTATDPGFEPGMTFLDVSGFDGEREKILVFRTYFTRHGVGPFPTEWPNEGYPELHNVTHPWMGKFRQGFFDYNLAEQAIGWAQPDYLAVTHCDRLEDRGLLSVPVKYRSYGPTWRNKVELPVQQSSRLEVEA